MLSVESKVPSPPPPSSAVVNELKVKDGTGVKIKDLSTTTGITQSTDNTDCMMSLLWRDYFEHGIEYHQYFSNHLAHSLISLHEMGASKGRMEDMFNYYSKMLRPRPMGSFSATSEQKESTSGANCTKAPDTLEKLLPLVGKLGWNECLAFFEHAWMEMVRESPEDDPLDIETRLIQEYFPSLMPFAVARATHPLIHLGWGRMLSEAKLTYWNLPASVEAHLSKSHLFRSSGRSSRRMNPVTIAGLAYLAFRGFRLDMFEGKSLFELEEASQSPDINTLSLAKVLEKTINMSKAELFPLVKAHEKDSHFKEKYEGSFMRRIGILSELGSKQTTELALSWKVDDGEESLDKKVLDLQQVMAFLYGISPNEFFVLHGCTSYFAFRQLFPLISSSIIPRSRRVIMLRQMLQVILAVFIAQRLPIQDKEMDIVTKFIRSEDVFQAMQNVMKLQPEYLAHNWQYLTNQAIASQGEHTQKLVMVFWRDARNADKMLDESSSAPSRTSNANVMIWEKFLRWCSAKRLQETDDEEDDE